MQNPERMIDVNVNRAAEGMRTLEDISRFILENKNLTTTIKKARHALRTFVPPHMDNRDTLGDVGTSVTTDSELSRQSMRDVAIAAGNRVCEALRVIEECFKLAGKGGEIEIIRYQMYDIAAEIANLLGTVHNAQWRLCFVLTASMCKLPWEETLRQVLEAGCDCIQIREKNNSSSELLQQAQRVMKIVAPFQVPVIINDRIDIMLAVGAGGVHLGSDDISVSAAKLICPPRCIVGSTVKSVEDAQRAVSQGADYVGIGAMFSSQTKPDVSVGGVDLLRRVIALNPDIHHLAIGGITHENCHELFEAGCNGVAISSDIARSESPGDVASACLAGEVQPS